MSMHQVLYRRSILILAHLIYTKLYTMFKLPYNPTKYVHGVGQGSQTDGRNLHVEKWKKLEESYFFHTPV